MSKSTQYIRFDNKMLHFDADVELVSMLVDSYAIWSSDTEELFPGSGNSDRYPVLAKRSISGINRKIAVCHLANTVYSSYIKDLSEELHIYLRSVVKEAWESAKIDPGRLVGVSNSKMEYTEILAYSRQNTLESEVIDRIFQHLESMRSDKDLIKDIQKKLGIRLNQDILSNAIGYLDVRHKLVHADGLVDKDWKSTHPFLRYKNYDKGMYSISLDYHTVMDARKAITQLIDCIDAEAINLGLIKMNTPDLKGGKN